MQTRWSPSCASHGSGPAGVLLSATVLACLWAQTAAGAARVEHLNAGGIIPEGPPFSEAVRVDDTVYLSGQIGVKPGTLELVKGGMAAEARQTLENIEATLRAHGLTMDHVVKCTVMLADMSQWGAFNEVYRSYFSAPYPARSAFGASGLALGAQVEVECLAVIRERTAPPADAAEADQPDEERTYRRPSAG